MTKSELRKTYLSKQEAISPGERGIESQKVADLFFRTFDLNQTKYLHCFISIEKFNEIDTALIFQRLWKDLPHIQVLVPRVDFESNEIKNLRHTSGTELVNNAWDIREPLHDEHVAAEEIDIVLVPLLCFDEDGYRVGYGKGFYDRLLTRCRPNCLKIGLSYFKPVERIADMHEGDVALDFCVTPEAIFTV